MPPRTVKNLRGSRGKNPAVAFNGSRYLVVWDTIEDELHPDSLDVYGRIINPDGTPAGPQFGISVRLWEQGNPVVACGKTSCLVVWEDRRSTGTVDIYGARVDKDGNLLDPNAFPICTERRGDQVSPALAFDGTNYLVAWTDNRNPVGYPDVYAHLVGEDGSLIGSDIPVVVASLIQRTPSVSFDGSSYLVTWTVLEENGDIYGQRIAVDGSLLGSMMPICNAPSSQGPPAAIRDGTRHLVVWNDSGDANAGIRGLRIDQAGTILDPGGFAISPGTTAADLGISSGPGRNLMIWYRRFDSTSGVYRVRSLLYDPSAVDLVSFSGRAAGLKVTLTWKTASETRNAGFHVYRGSAPEGPWTLVNPALIPGAGTSTDPHSYQFIDSVPSNGKYYYLLEDVDTAGVATTHDPIQVSVGPACGNLGEGPSSFTAELVFLGVAALVGKCRVRRRRRIGCCES